MNFKIFITLIFSVVSFYTSNAQTDGCDFVSFSVNYVPADCATNNDDEFCIVMIPAFSDEDCFDLEAGYVWRVRYPNTFFTITNLFDFSFNNSLSTAQTTVLETQSLFAADIQTITHCFEGNVIGSNVTFTFTLESMDASDVIQTVVVNTGNTPTISGTTTVSQEIGQTLLPLAQAQNQSQSIIIDGHLIIDENYVFTNASQILMADENSKITVNAGVSFSLRNGSIIRGCNIIWDEIENNGQFSITDGSRIQDATIAINSTPGSSLFTRNMFIEDCITGVRLTDNVFSTFIGNVFQPSLFRNCDLGLDLNNVSGTVFVPYWNFIDSRAGIDATNSDLIITDCNFDAINSSNPFLPFPNAAAITVRNSVNFSASDCTYFDCDNAINVFNVDDVVINGIDFPSSFNSNFRDIFINSQLSQRSRITNNEFTNTNSQNILFNMQPGTSIVNDNVFGFNNNAGLFSANIALYAIGTGDHDLNIQDNRMRSLRENVIFRNAYRASVFNNDWLISGGRGISVSGGESNIVTFNEAVLTNAEAVIFSLSPHSDVNCNDNVESQNRAGLSILNNNDGMEVLANELTGALGLEYSASATTGMQLYKGNIFLAGTIDRAIHNGSFANILNDLYFVNEIPLGGGLTFKPQFNAGGINWFPSGLQFNETCPSPPPAPPTIDGLDQLVNTSDIPNILSIATRVKDITQIDTDSLWITSYPFYKILQSVYSNCSNNCLDILFQDWVNSTTFSNEEVESIFPDIVEDTGSSLELTFDSDEWLNDVSSLYDDIYQYELAAQDIGKLSASDQTTLDNSSATIESLRANYVTYLDGLTLTDTVSTDTSTFYMQAIDTQTNIMKSIYVNQAGVNATDLATLSSLSNAINVPNLSVDDHFKFVVDISIGLMSGQNKSNYYADTTMLKNLADGCPSTIGVAKYHAQSLYTHITDYIGNFIDNCSGPSRRPVTIPKQNQALNEVVKVYPNPTVDNIQIEKLDDQIERVAIYNALGIKISEPTLKDHITRIDISSFAEGVYYIQKLDGETLGSFIKI